MVHPISFSETLPGGLDLSYTKRNGHFRVVYSASFMVGKPLDLPQARDVKRARRVARYFLPAAIFDNLMRLFADFDPTAFPGGWEVADRWSEIIQELGTALQRFCSAEEAQRRWLKTNWNKK